MTSLVSLKTLNYFKTSFMILNKLGSFYLVSLWHVLTVIFLPMKPTPFTCIVPKVKKYLFSPIRGRKIPKMSGNFPIKLKPILTLCRSCLFVIHSMFIQHFQPGRREIHLLAPVTLFCLHSSSSEPFAQFYTSDWTRQFRSLGSVIFNLTSKSSYQNDF